MTTFQMKEIFQENYIPEIMKKLDKWIPLKDEKPKQPKYKGWQEKQYSFDTVKDTNNKAAGFVINGSGLVVLDFDKVANAKGELGNDVKKCLDNIKWLLNGDTYTERSISGRGLHMFLKVDAPKDLPSVFKIHLGQKLEESDSGSVNTLEVYTGNDSGKYFAVTGNIIGDCKTVAGGEGARNVLSYLWELKKAERPDKNNHSEVRAGTPSNDGGSYHLPNDAAGVVALIRHVEKKNINLFNKLYDMGDTSDYGNDDSAADMALMNLLPFYTAGDPELMRAVFSSSALAGRDKWKKRLDYQNMTIQKAIDSWNHKTYNPKEYFKEMAGKRLNSVIANNGFSAETIQRLPKYPMTDTGNAERFALLSRNDLYFISEMMNPKTKGPKWLIWNGKKWQRIFDADLYGRVTDTARITKTAVQTYETDEKVAKAKTKFLTRSENQCNIDACLKRVQGMMAISIDSFDKDPYLLNVQNGVLDLRSGELYPHDKKFKQMKICRAAYRPELAGRPSLWTQALAAMVPDEKEREYLQMWAGYMLCGSAVEEKCLFLYGEGGTGKSTFAETLSYMMGDYSDTVDVEVFLASHNDGGSGKASPSIAKLTGTRLAIGAETGIGRKMNTAKLKTLTGRDTVTARFLYGNEFRFTPCAKFLFTSNYLPKVTDATDSGARRRIVIAPFTNVPDSKNIFLKDELRKQENIDAVLAWCVEGFHKWDRDRSNGGKGRLEVLPPRYEQTAAKFYRDSDTLQQFLDSECETGPIEGKNRKFVTVKALFTAYKNYLCETVKRSVFMEQMRRKGYERVDGRANTSIFQGIALKDDNKFGYVNG